jgi:cystathionine beta-lyase/cystathionine gamma-synthase
VYGGTYRQFDKVFKQFGITYTRVDMTDLNGAEAAFTAKTKLVWIETPTNPLLKVIDIGAVARLAKSKGALTVVDNTFAPGADQPALAGCGHRQPFLHEIYRRPLRRDRRDADLQRR